MKIRMSSPDLSEADRQAVEAVVNTPNLSMGPKIDAFEKAFCELTGAKHAIGVNSGTAGLHLCIRAAEINPGDIVITTPFSFVASSNVILFEKAIPVFVDVDPVTGNIDTDQLARAVEDLSLGGERADRWMPRKLPKVNQGRVKQLKAILPVDVFGQPADYDLINALAEQYGLKVIEDSCEALGGEYKGRYTGTLGDYGVFAFYPNKQITTGEGGMIITDDDETADFMRALRNQGRAPGDTWLQHTFLGYNYRLDEMSAALGLSQLRRLESLLEKRARVADWYTEHLENIEEVTPPQLVENTTKVSWFVYVIKVDEKIDRDRLAVILEEMGVPVRPYFAPIHTQPYMVKMFGYQQGDFPVTEDLGNRSLALPFSGRMSEEEVLTVCQRLAEALISVKK
ncbi:MAG: DegT/DnrJ/EryC1/StrS family aminotransferase [Brevefilum sp.]|nr:DegT/DnrJ/EryC1/StrS family aminotransferase [Brevefilum sp.]MDT8381976.1 DegT/DnrJ/EryC1/StrS family aminotransferase [Brevefilum sp.]MDW7754481.1 DegT/DnrJ/EryC1/StrS family aminotransferase [Brevefilum sp.]